MYVHQMHLSQIIEMMIIYVKKNVTYKYSNYWNVSKSKEVSWQYSAFLSNAIYTF